MPANGDGPALLWLSGFLSDMASTKAAALAAWAEGMRLPMLRFDYSGHGLSEGDLLHASIGDWLEEAAAVLELIGTPASNPGRLVDGRVDRAACSRASSPRPACSTGWPVSC